MVRDIELARLAVLFESLLDLSTCMEWFHRSVRVQRQSGTKSDMPTAIVGLRFKWSVRGNVADALSGGFRNIQRLKIVFILLLNPISLLSMDQGIHKIS